MIDDERVIALLHESVPAVPDVPGRVVLVRRRAARQRAHAWTQAMGAAVAVVLLAGLVSAVAAPRPSGPVPSVSDPVRVMTDALGKQRSVRFEFTVTPVGPVSAYDRIDAATMRRILTSRLVGQLGRDGTGQVDGDVALYDLLIGEDPTHDIEFHLRWTKQAMYHRAAQGERVPGGKPWIVDKQPAKAFDLDLYRRKLAAAAGFADPPRFVGDDGVRGTPVAVYRVRVPGRLVHGPDIVAEVSLDRAGRPRRVTMLVDVGSVLTAFAGAQDETPAPLPRMTVRVTLDLYGYNDRVVVTPPPASEVTTSDGTPDVPCANKSTAPDGSVTCTFTSHATVGGTMAPVPPGSIPIGLTPSPSPTR